MLENLKNQERLSPREEDRIDNRIRIIILVMTGIVVAVIIWAVVKKKPLGPWYYALILTLLAIIWILKCVVAGLLNHALAQRTDEQVAAYLKAAGLELASYAGLGWFLIGLNGNGIIGAVIYLIAMTTGRKQMELYYKEPGEEEDADGSAETSGQNPKDGELDRKADEAREPEESDVLAALPSAANREQREQESEKESEDGSV